MVGRSRRAVFDMMMVLAEGTLAVIGVERVRLCCCLASEAGRGARHPGARDRRASRSSGGFCAAIQKRRANPAGVTVSATHSTTHDDATGHHHAGSPVRLPGGQRACVVSHEADYDGLRRNASNRTDAGPCCVTECYTLLNRGLAARCRATPAATLRERAGEICCQIHQNTCAIRRECAYHHCRSVSAKRFDESDGRRRRSWQW